MPNGYDPWKEYAMDLVNSYVCDHPQPNMLPTFVPTIEP